MTNKQTQHNFDSIYQNIPLDEIPWNRQQPPELIIELLESGRIKPCRALDLGCGAGNLAIYLASRGFDVTAVDISPAAVKIAIQNAKAKNVKCQFLTADVIENFPQFDEPFSFIYDWGLLHHIPPQHRRQYLHNLHNILNDTATYISLSLNEKDTYFKGTDKTRKSKLGTRIYLSSEDELKQLWKPYFKIIDFRLIDNISCPAAHIFNFAILKNNRPKEPIKNKSNKSSLSLQREISG